VISTETRVRIAGTRGLGSFPAVIEHAGIIMARHFDQRAFERAAAIVRVAGRYSGDELDAALKAARRAMEYCLEEARAGANASRALLEAVDAAQSIARYRA
jgi:hypothetical protein